MNFLTLINLGDGGPILATQTSSQSYSEKKETYKATQVAAWETITITNALPNSLIWIMIYNPTNNDEYGVRMVGSALDRKWTSLSDNTLTLPVKTNSDKEVQFYTDDPTNTDFDFIAQM